MNIVDAIVAEHTEWWKSWIEEIPPPAEHDEFVRLMVRAYTDAFIHGFKHGYERALLEHEKEGDD